MAIERALLLLAALTWGCSSTSSAGSGSQNPGFQVPTFTGVTSCADGADGGWEGISACGALSMSVTGALSETLSGGSPVQEPCLGAPSFEWEYPLTGTTQWKVSVGFVGPNPPPAIDQTGTYAATVQIGADYDVWWTNSNCTIAIDGNTCVATAEDLGQGQSTTFYWHYITGTGSCVGAVQGSDGSSLTIEPFKFLTFMTNPAGLNKP